MDYNPDIHKRKSIRLKDYDYSSIGEYFVTICTKDKECYFGDVEDENVQISGIGRIARDVWLEIEQKFNGVALDEFVFMPNHLNGILTIRNRRRGLINQTPTNKTRTVQKNVHEWVLMKNPNQTLGKIIRFFKAKASKLIRDSGFHNFAWQRNYYERIVRDEKELNRIRRYVIDNPLQWESDNENPKNRETKL